MRKMWSVLALVLLPCVVRAESSSARFALSSSAENPRCLIAVNSFSYRYGFRPPVNWRASQDHTQKGIRFQASANSSVLTVRFKDEPVGVLTKEGRCQRLQELILKFPNARLQRRSETAALSGKALILDLAWTARNSAQRVGRFARVPLAAGTVEVSLLASSDEDFESSLPAFRELLNSLQGFSDESDLRS